MFKLPQKNLRNCVKFLFASAIAVARKSSVTTHLQYFIETLQKFLKDRAENFGSLYSHTMNFFSKTVFLKELILSQLYCCLFRHKRFAKSHKYSLQALLFQEEFASNITSTIAHLFHLCCSGTFHHHRELSCTPLHINGALQCTILMWTVT